MDIQSTLTLAIEIIFWAMIVLMLNDFVNGFFKNFTQSQYTVISAQLPSPVAEIKDIPNPVVAESEAPQEYKFEEIPDPWNLEVELHTTTEQQPVVIQFPAQEVQPQPKRRGRQKKSGDSIQPTATAKSPQKRSRTRKSA